MSVYLEYSQNVSDFFIHKFQMHVLGSITLFPRKSYRLLDNVVKYDKSGQATDEYIIMCIRFAYWITKTTDTHTEYVILTAYPLQQWLH
jgi:hypothetical protein